VKEVIVILVAAGLAALSIFVQFCFQDKNKRKRFEGFIEVPAGLVGVAMVFFVATNFRVLNKLALWIALMILIVPIILYPASPAYRDDKARSKQRANSTMQLSVVSKRKSHRKQVSNATPHFRPRNDRHVSTKQPTQEARECLEGHPEHHFGAHLDLP